LTAQATIFSRRTTAFDHEAVVVNFISTVDMTESSLTSGASNTLIPQARKRYLEATELETAPLISSFIVAKASINLFTVGAVPTPQSRHAHHVLQRGLSHECL
jgi:hypothetical protein